MRVSSIIVLFILFRVGSSISQDSLIIRECDLGRTLAKRTNLLTLQTTYSKTGLYNGLTWHSDFYKGVMVNMSLATKFRHLVLGKFTPLVSLGVGYDVLRNREKLKFIPGFRGQLITSRLSQNSVANNLEMLVGYTFIWGNRFRFVQGSYYGLGNESSSNFNVLYSSFVVHIGFGYAF